MAKKLTRAASAPVVNEYAQISILLNVLEKRKKELKKLLKDSGLLDPEKPLRTNTTCIAYSVTPTERLDVDRIREEMPTDWIKKYTEKGTRENMDVTHMTGLDAYIKKVEITPKLVQELIDEFVY